MNCEKCGSSIPAEEEREHYGKTLCEDCYMDALSPARTCDPWAVHSAKTFSEAVGKAGLQLNVTQKRLITILTETGGVEPLALRDRLGLSESEFEREIAALRHVEMIRAEMREGRKVIRLW
jgi:hypothetical protein